MVQYTLAEHPEVIINVSGKDSRKAREKAMDQLVEMLDNNELPSELPNGFGLDQFIEVKELPDPSNRSQEDEVMDAVQLLSNLASLKLKMQDLKKEALTVRQHVDLLFSDEPITEEQVAALKEGFKVLKTFAQSNLRYMEAKAQAENARRVLDEALNGQV
ncbi:MAG: hypothetical protein Kow00121_01010 [Elainellaceae cyanobacterium]